jgi:hypothetical protein
VHAFTVPVAKPTGRPHRFRRVVLLTTAVAATFASALALADARLEPKTAAGPALVTSDVDGSRLTSPAAAAPRHLLSSPTPPAVVRPGSAQRFVWAPVEGASGYHVEIFRENSLVFAADTDRPELIVPAKWRFHGSEHRWEPVAFRWYVWPIVSGERTTRAVVQARLVVRDR